MTTRTDELFAASQADQHARTSRMFAVLMCAQWVFGVGVALLWSPLAWKGTSSSVHVHVYTAMILGALISAAPIALALTRPSAPLTRYVIAAAQMLWSALLIHLTGGRIETHFHVFGSLAFLAFYRDWKVLVPATLVVAGEHFLRGMLWPESVYGSTSTEWWRFVEHALWVVFEDIVLVLGCLRGTQEARAVAERQAEAEQSLARVNELNQDLDRRVAERTAHLEKTQAELVDASRRAGKADVATAVLHNVGNVLNSINVSCGVLLDTVQASKSSRLIQAAALLGSSEVAPLLESHPKAKQLSTYLAKLGNELGDERGRIATELRDLQGNIEHVKVIVATQQAHAKGAGGVLEAVPFDTLVHDALRLTNVSRQDKDVEVTVHCDTLPPTLLDRHKVFQILMNLISNARHAIKAEQRLLGKLGLRLTRNGDRARLEVQDNGCGIAPADISRIFNLGFTTKKEGHGFGLHSSACAAVEMGGRLTAESEGKGHGATFILELPLQVDAVRAAA